MPGPKIITPEQVALRNLTPEDRVALDSALQKHLEGDTAGARRIAADAKVLDALGVLIEKEHRKTAKNAREIDKVSQKLAHSTKTLEQLKAEKKIPSRARVVVHDRKQGTLDLG